MKKRLISLLLMLSMVLTLIPTTAFAVEGKVQTPSVTNPFTDVKEGDWCYDAVQYARMNGFFNGTSKTKFTPNGTMTRGMFVTVLGRMAGVDTELYEDEKPFSDVPTRMYYAPYVAWAYKHGITGGTGEGKFSPDALINRQQMATFFVRYFEAFGVNYDTGANITTVPADMDSVAPYAKDAVLKLWKQGLLNGDGKNFNPAGNATRAQAATLTMRTDKAVDTWYKEPGVASDRVSIDPAELETEQPETPETPETPATPSKPSGGSSGGSGGGGSGDTVTTYYQVTFELGNGMTPAAGENAIQMPENKAYAEGTKFTMMPTPYQLNGVFMGWYYDEDMNYMVGANDVLTDHTTLYAKMGDLSPINESNTPNYVTVQLKDTEVSGFSFAVMGGDEDPIASFVNVTRTNEPIAYTVGSNGTVSVVLEQGQTYRVELEDGLAVYDLPGRGGVQAVSTRVLNIITEKAPVKNLTLDPGLKYLPAGDVSNLSDTQAGLYTMNLRNGGDMTQNQNSGTFDYDGQLQIGDVVAIYQGTTPEELTGNTLTESSGEQSVVYVKVTEIVDEDTYAYVTPDSEEVLFTPDVLPIYRETLPAFTATGNEIVVPVDALDFSDESPVNGANKARYNAMGLDGSTTVDVGDFVTVYATAWNDSSVNTGDAGAAFVYGCITAVTKDDENYTITFDQVGESEILAAMDLYASREEQVFLTEEEAARIEQAIEDQSISSGFADVAATYLVALAMETDGFQQLSDDAGLNLKNYTLTYPDGTPVNEADMALMSDKVKWEKKEINAQVDGGKNVLQHLGGEDGDDRWGVRAELVIDIEIHIDDKLIIEMQAVFEQEVLLSVNASGGAIWKWAWIIPYIYDYNLNANLDLGTYTGIGITATAHTKGEEEEEDEGFDWDMRTDNDAGNAIIDIGKQIKELMEKKDEFMGEVVSEVENIKDTIDNPLGGILGDDDEDEDEEETEWKGSVDGSGLAEKYAAMMEAAEDTWIELFRVEIFASEGFVDPLHILCYGISADFVVSANMYITMGMTLTYANAKRYNFSLMLFHQTATNEVIDLEEARFNFDFYVMGTLGIRAGIEFEIAMGLFSLKLDSVGICAEAGIYAQLWGYFYYHYTWTASEGTDTSYSGAMLIEIGAYLSISFKAQAFSSDKLTYQPTIYENEWAFLTIGSEENVYDFAYPKDDERLAFALDGVKQATLPIEIFDMNYMDMKSGEIHGSDSEDSEDDEDEEPDNPEPANYGEEAGSHYHIELSDPEHFSFDPETNEITVTPGQDDEALTCEIKFTWKNATLAFTSRSLSRTVTVEWSAPKDAYGYIAFDSNGGSYVPVLAALSFTSITDKLPADPTRVGYDFAGWYLNGERYEFPEKMPNFWEDETVVDGTITLQAQWIPRDDTKFVVEYYLENLSGKYVLDTVDEYEGTTEELAYISGLSDKPHDTKDSEITARTFTNFTLNDAYYATVVDGAIAPDGTLKLKLYYDRDYHTVTFGYGNPTGVDASTIPGDVVYRVKHGNTVYAPILALGGYDFNGFPNLPELNEAGGITVTGDLTYEASWSPSANTAFRVEHYLSRIGNVGGYLMPDSSYARNHTGITNEVVAAKDLALDIAGLDYSHAKIGETLVDSITVKPDGSAVIKLYYDRKSFNINFMDGEDTLKTVSYIYGQSTEGYTPEKTGFGFADWYETADFSGDPYTFGKMPAEDVTLYAKWEEGAQNVSVQHYVMDTEGNYPTQPTKTESIAAKTNDVLVLAECKDAELEVADGIVLDETLSKVGNTVPEDGKYTVPASGAEIIKLYYKRLPYTVTWQDGENSEEVTYYYEAEIEVPELTKLGYTGAWDPAPAAKMPAKDVTYTAQWSASSTIVYKVEHYQQNADDDGYTLKETTTHAGTTNSKVTAPAKSYEYFVLNENAEGTVQSGTVAADGSLVLKLYYDREMVTVTFKANGGELTGESTATFRYGAKLTAAEPTRTSYTFIGWYTAAVGGDKVDLGSAVNGSMTLYAHWSAGSVGYKVEHYIMDTDGQMPASPSYVDNKSGLADEQVEISTLVTKEVSGAITFDKAKVGEETVTTATLAEGVAVKLYYNREKVTVTFNANGGKFDGGSTTKTEDFYYQGKLATTAPTHDTLIFSGWYTAATGGTKVNVGTEITTARTLYAQWQENIVSYTVEHYLRNGGTSSANYTYAVPVVEEITAKAGAEILSTNFATKAYTTPNNEKLIWIKEIYCNDQKVHNGYTPQYVTIQQDMVVKVYYDRQSFTVNWGGLLTTRVYYGDPVIEPTVDANGKPFEKEGYTLACWCYDQYGNSPMTPGRLMYNQNLELYPKWEPKQITINFQSNRDGVSVESITQGAGTNLTLPTPTSENFVFVGWYADEALTQKFTDTKMPTANKTLYGKWTGKEATVTFQSQYTGYTDLWPYGDAQKNATLKVVYGEPYGKCLYEYYNQFTYYRNELPTLNDDKVKANLNDDMLTVAFFKGWVDSENNYITADTIVSASGDHTLTAVWDRPKTNVTFYLEKEDIGDPDKAHGISAERSVGSNVYIKGGMSTPQKTGYNFSGWISEDVENNLYLDTSENGVAWIRHRNQDLNFYTAWTAKTYKITYNQSIQGSYQISTSDLISEWVSVNTMPYRLYTPTLVAWGEGEAQDHEFLGWYLNGNEAKKIEYVTLDNVEDVAEWGLRPRFAHKRYDITYDLGDNEKHPATNDKNNPTYFYSSRSGTLADPTRPGYIFEGWITDGVTTPTKGISYGGTVRNDQKFTAVWTPITYTISYYQYNPDTHRYEGVKLPEEYLTSFTVEDEGVYRIPSYEYEEYEFVGWNAHYNQLTEYKLTEIDFSNPFKYLIQVASLPTNTNSITLYAECNYLNHKLQNIDNIAELKEVARRVSTGELGHMPSTIYLNAAITLDNSWTLPIGTAERPFTGQFVVNRGGAKIIYDSSAKVPLFGYLGDSAEVSGLTVEVNDITIESGNWGSIAYENNGAIYRCYVLGNGNDTPDITHLGKNVSASNPAYVGGYVAVNNGEISNAWAGEADTPLVIRHHSAGTNAYAATGGIAGVHSNGEIRHPYAYSGKYHNVDIIADGGYVGGIAGKMENASIEIENTTHPMTMIVSIDVTRNNADIVYAGGLVGELGKSAQIVGIDGSYEQSRNGCSKITVTVAGSNKSGGIGGIAGVANGTIDYLELTDCNLSGKADGTGLFYGMGEPVTNDLRDGGNNTVNGVATAEEEQTA